MSTIVGEKKKRTRKTKVEAEVVVAPVVEVKNEPEPEPEHEEPEPDVANIPEEKEKEDEITKIQKKKLIYEEIKSDLEGLLSGVSEDIAAAKIAKNKDQIALFKFYEKILKKLLTNVKKLEPKEKKTIVRSQPSGFNKPLTITPEIAAFAGWNVNEKKSRTDVTVFLCDYVKRNNLQKPDHRRTILPDEKLTKILRYNVNSEPPLTYSTMQKYIGHLFVSA